MADPETPTGATPERRERRRHRSHRRVQRVATVAATLVVIAAVALFAFDVVHIGGGDKPSAAGTVHAASNAPVHDATTTTAGRECRPLTTADPLRLWVGGDSLAGSLGPSLGTIAGATGVVQPYFDSRVSSGLSDPGFFDWPDHATTEMARLDPDVVVFIIGTNDWTAVSGSWKDTYATTVDSMMKTLVGGGRTVYWLGAPTLKDQQKDSAVVQVNAVAQEVAKHHPTVHYVDTYKLFSDADGTFAYDLPDESGKVVTMRGGDGVHLTTDGADYLARHVYKLVDAQCAITAQKVAGVTLPTIETEGSTQVAPGSSSGSSSGNSYGSGSSGYSGSTIQTTPPATAPPSTSPPAPNPPTPTTSPASTTISTPSTGDGAGGPRATP